MSTEMHKRQLISRQEDRACGCCGLRWQVSLENKGTGGEEV